MKSILGLALAVMAAASCSSPDPSTRETCPDEDLVVNVEGTCLAATGVSLSVSSCHLTLGGAAATPTTPSVGLPRRGAMGPDGGPVRQGGFRLFGDVCAAGLSTAACAESAAFRVCTARRVDWWLDLTCVDDQGAPVCTARLTE